MTLKATDAEVAIYAGKDEIARHRRATGRAEDVVDPGHVQALLETKRRGERGVIVARFVALGPAAEGYLRGLVRAEVSLYRHLRRILALADCFGRTEVIAAITHAAEHGAFGADYVERIVHQERRRRHERPQGGPLALPHAPDLAAITLPEIDLDIYDRALGTGESHAEDHAPRPGGPPPGEPRRTGTDPDAPDLPRPPRESGQGGPLLP